MSRVDLGPVQRGYDFAREFARQLALDQPCRSESSLTLVLDLLAERGCPAERLDQIRIAAELDPSRRIRDLLADYRAILLASEEP